jgi:shikimate kinase
MQGARNIFLVGLMGAGKTTIGRALARRLGKSFYDADHELVARTGVPIPTIFELEGEEGFRQREAQVIGDLTQVDDVVLATGGGAVLREDNRTILSSRGFVIYLRAQPRDLWLRTRNDQNRPLLRTGNPLARLEELYRDRDPLYEQVADLVVDTGRQRVNLLMAQILNRLPAECKLSA